MRLGDLLIDLGHLREADLRAALAAQQASGGNKRLGEILVESRVMSERKLTEVLADLFGRRSSSRASATSSAACSCA